MKDIRWIINRLKTMSLPEILWRLREKVVQDQEHQSIYDLHKPVTDIPLPPELLYLHIDLNKLPINWDHRQWTAFERLDLFGIFDYAQYKDRWNAGFQTVNTWPETPFSPTIHISQRTDIGDIRTNWELNRHFQFAALAKSYYCTKEHRYLVELESLFHDWNAHNLFLHGVEWVSAMELAIRVNSWIYMFCFLKKAGYDGDMLFQIEHGILVMVDYISRHRSRFSSANNHLIVEMYAVALTGILTEYSPWRDDALKVLTEELQKQNYADGVNKEMSIHYQSFVMESYGLLWIVMEKNGIAIPLVWKEYLTAMTNFLADSMDDRGVALEFGDNDEGKILDLSGELRDYYLYVLNLMGYILHQRYTDAHWHENLNWILTDKAVDTNAARYIPNLVCCRRAGGYTFLRSTDRRIFIGIDHAALGFGSLAAHGHADALSFQMAVDGCLVFVDPGTYLYHCGLARRNAIRGTANHNTATVNNKDQSEMLGPFLWGRRAECQLLNIESTSDKTVLTAQHNGYQPIIHKRVFKFDHRRTLCISDLFSKVCDASVGFVLAPGMNAAIEGNVVHITSASCSLKMEFSGDSMLDLSLQSAMYSERYAVQERTTMVRVKSHGRAITTTILVWEGAQ